MCMYIYINIYLWLCATSHADMLDYLFFKEWVFSSTQQKFDGKFFIDSRTILRTYMSRVHATFAQQLVLTSNKSNTSKLCITHPFRESTKRLDSLTKSQWCGNCFPDMIPSCIKKLSIHITTVSRFCTLDATALSPWNSITSRNAILELQLQWRHSECDGVSNH